MSVLRESPWEDRPQGALTPAEARDANTRPPARNTEGRPGVPLLHEDCVFSQTAWEMISAKPHTPLLMKTDTLLGASER